MTRLSDWLRASGLAEGGLMPSYRAEAVSSKRLEESWDESKHARDKNGQFITKGQLSAAADDPAKAKALLKRVRPEDKAALKSQIRAVAEQHAAIPEPHTIGAKTYQVYARKMAKIYSAALRGDIEAVQAVETNGTSKTYWIKKTHQYKQRVLAVLQARQARGMEPVSAELDGLPASFKLRKSTARVVMDASTEKAFYEWLPKAKSEGINPATLVGAPDEATVEVTRLSDSSPIRISVRHARGIESLSRKIIKEGNEVYIYNALFEADGKVPGIGRKVLTDQVIATSRAGVSRLDVTAAGQKGSSMNGYYTWPRYGYDGPIPYAHREAATAISPNNKTMLDLMSTPEGRDYWKQRGATLSLSFDLTPGSRSIRVLGAYLSKKEN